VRALVQDLAPELVLVPELVPELVQDLVPELVLVPVRALVQELAPELNRRRHRRHRPIPMILRMPHSSFLWPQ